MSALIKKSLADDAVVADDALITLFEPNGPKTLEAVTNDAVDAVPSNDPVNDEADTDPNTDKLPVNEVLPVTIKEPVIVWLPLNMFDPVIANTVEFSPSNKSALLAYEAVIANEELVEPLA